MGPASRTALGGAARLLVVLGLAVACDPGSEAGFAPVEPLPRPDVDAVPAPWWPAEEEAVTADAQVLDVLVLEQECAGGEPARDRIRDPLIEADDDRIVVTLEVEVLEEPVTCPDNPPTPTTIDLGEPRGDRARLDGSTDPPREPRPPE